MQPRGVFKSKEACEGRKLAGTRKEMQAQEDIMTDRFEIEARLRKEAATAKKQPQQQQQRKNTKRINELRQQLAVPAEAYRAMNHNQNHDHDHDRVQAVLNTFRYMYERHQRGVYVSIRDGKVSSFVGFHKAKNWRNPLARYLRLHPDARVVASKRYQELGIDPPITYNPPFIWNNIGCLIGSVAFVKQRELVAGYEASYNHGEVRFFLDRVCESSRVPDCDFFVNYYDQVILRRDLRVPFWHIIGNATKVPPPPTGAKGPMAPIVSMCTKPGFIDIPFVFPDDIARAWAIFGAPRCSNNYLDEASYEMQWSKKRPLAVFRGSATGCGWTPETNDRLRLAQLSVTHAELLDAKLTYPKDEPHYKKHASETWVRYVPIVQDPDAVLTPAEQSRYKYVVYAEGNVAAYRLSSLFSFGSMVIYIVGDDYRGWFHPLLQHRRNCYIVKDADGALDAVRWARANDREAQRIAEAGLQMYRERLGREGMLRYGAEMLDVIARINQV
jgi:hypothetical protein